MTFKVLIWKNAVEPRIWITSKINIEVNWWNLLLHFLFVVQQQYLFVSVLQVFHITPRKLLCGQQLSYGSHWADSCFPTISSISFPIPPAADCHPPCSAWGEVPESQPGFQCLLPAGFCSSLSLSIPFPGSLHLNHQRNGATRFRAWGWVM